MKKRNLFKILLILILIIFTWFIYSKYFKKSNDLLSVIINTTDTINITDPADTKTAIEEEVIYNSNIIKDINYTSRDLRGNEYILVAKEGEIDLNNSYIIFLTDVTANIKLAKNS